MKPIGPDGSIPSFSMLSPDWRKPFNISIGLHIIVLAVAMLAPTLFDRQPKLPEIYTVNLFTAVEVADRQTPAPPKSSSPKETAQPAVSTPVPETKKPVVSIQPAKPEMDPALKSLAENPISLQPLKQKVKIGKTKEEEALDKARLNKVKQQLLAGAAQQEAEKAAARAKKDAVKKLADYINTNAATTTAAAADGAAAAAGPASKQAQTAAVSGPRGAGIEPDFYMKQYLSTVYQKIHDHWVLPDLQNWDTSLEAVLIIAIRKDGVIASNFFERKSDNIYFNQFVLKAVKDASPLPPFPDQIQEDTLEIGLRFKPGELY